MEAIEIVRRVMQDQGKTAGIAREEMKQLADLHRDHPRTLQKARQGSRFLSRWACYEIEGKLGEEDFLLTLRDTVLMLGKFSGTVRVKNLVARRGGEFGLYEEPTGEIGAVLPEDQFVRQCYGLDESIRLERRKTAGDRILKEETGFESYKSFEQKVAVHTAIKLPEGYTQLVTLSTGEGKSTVTHMSVATDPGLTVLVVPTIALGKDQVRAARSVLKRVSDEVIYDFCGDQTEKLPALKERLKKKEIRLLITSPEALVKNTGLREAILIAAREKYLSRLIIDEAHIVQDWGAAFRPDFQFLSLLRKEWLKESGGSLRTILLSATLTEEAVHSLKELFSEMEGNIDRWIAVRCDSLRTEIRYMTDLLKWSDGLQQEQEKRVLHYVKTLPKPMLIYAIKPDDINRWAQFLEENGIQNTAVFTGLTEDEERSRIIDLWSRDQLDLVLATSAFGMGIDKPDVRTVMHVVMPENINRFYQEVGRGGRDGRPSLSMLCCCPQAEYHQASNITHRKVMTWEKMAKRWLEMIKVGNVQADVIELDTRSVPEYFNKREREFSGNRNRDWNLHTILFMVRHGWIELIDLKYACETGDYLVKVRMKDPVLLQDREKVLKLGEEARKSDFDASDRELKVFQEMIREKDNHCFAESFSRIYVHADLDCGGCPQHKGENFHSYGYRLHSSVPEYKGNDDEALPYRTWRRNHCLLIRQNDPEDDDMAEAFSGLVLNMDEAAVLLERHPALLGKAILLSMGKDSRENQRMMDFGLKVIRKGISVAFHMNPDTVCHSEGKPLYDVVMSRTMTEQELE